MTSAEHAPTTRGRGGVRAHVGSRPRPDGNATDLRYVQQACAALGPIMAACESAASRSERHDVRAVAGRAYVAQTHGLRAISDVLRAWGRADLGRRTPTDAETLAGLAGRALDRSFVERLSAHTSASIAAARAELVTGASPAARALAERAIHAEDRQLAALQRLTLFAALAPERDRQRGPWSAGRE